MPWFSCKQAEETIVETADLKENYMKQLILTVHDTEDKKWIKIRK